MGCDIHAFVEQYDKKSKQWIPLKIYQENPWYNPESEDKEDHEKFRLVDVWNASRDYEAFTALAGVRNRDGIIQFAKQRGLPDNASQEYIDLVDKWDCDGHSHSFIYWYELIEYVKEYPNTKYSGMISPEAANDLKENNILPKMWCQATTQKDWEKHSWLVPGSALKWHLESLRSYITFARCYLQPEYIRVCFFFDN